MGRRHRFTVEKCAGIFLIVFGALTIFRWVFQNALIATLIPGSALMGVVAPLLFLAAGVCCFEWSPHRALEHSLTRTAIERTCRILLVVIPSFILIEHLFNVNLGLDLQRVVVAPTPDTPHPGRVSANASLAFLLAGVALNLMRTSTQRYQRFILSMCVYSAIAISFSSLIGHFIRVETMYRFASGNKMLAPTAFAMSVLSGTLWIILQKVGSQLGDKLGDKLNNAQRRITYRSILILAMVALSAGAAGFAVMRDGYEQTINSNIRLLASTNATSFTHIIEVSLRLPKTIAVRPSLRLILSVLDQHSNDAKTLVSLKEFGENNLAGGLTGVAFYSTSGVLLSQSGIMVHDAPVTHELQTADQKAQLRWANGYILHAENQVVMNGRQVGKILTQERMPVIDKLLADIQASSAGTDALVCGRDQANAVCAPSRFYLKPFKIPMYNASGKLNFPINRALVGESGVTITPDLQGVMVYAAYLPLGDLGLGMVVKTSADALYAPLRARFIQLLAVMVTLVLLGTSVLLLQVRPLVVGLNRERERSTVILETSTDAFIALGIDGMVTDWNRAAEKIFGWSVAETLGRNLADLIIPKAQRAAHNAGFAQFIQSGSGPVINATLEVNALKKNGETIPIELSIVAHHNGDGYLANAFLRDISDRKAILEKVSSSEKRLRTITDNLPVLITYIDERRYMMFANATIKPWLGITPEQVQGKLFEDVVGPIIYAERREYINRALAGERVEFEITSSAAGATRHLHTVYLPDVRDDKVVQGFYTLTSDISELKAKEAALSVLARVDTLAGIANRLQLNELLAGALARSRRMRAEVAVMYLDIDFFKQINDGYGHATGDAVLIEFATRLQASVRKTDAVARLSGDEFIVVLEGLNSIDEAGPIAQKILAAVRAPFAVSGLNLQITTSIGVGYASDFNLTCADLLRMADAALYRSKEAGRDRVSF